jgi:site-specific recombinase XerD
LDILRKIIDKYEQERNSLTLLPVMSNQKLNSYLKELADICGITKRLNFHVARHSFSTSIMLDHGVSMETLKCWGIATLKLLKYMPKSQIRKLIMR